MHLEGNRFRMLETIDDDCESRLTEDAEAIHALGLNNSRVERLRRAREAAGSDHTPQGYDMGPLQTHPSPPRPKDPKAPADPETSKAAAAKAMRKAAAVQAEVRAEQPEQPASSAKGKKRARFQ